MVFVTFQKSDFNFQRVMNTKPNAYASVTRMSRQLHIDVTSNRVCVFFKIREQIIRLVRRNRVIPFCFWRSKENKPIRFTESNAFLQLFHRWTRIGHEKSTFSPIVETIPGVWLKNLTGGNIAWPGPRNTSKASARHDETLYFYV